MRMIYGSTHHVSNEEDENMRGTQPQFKIRQYVVRFTTSFSLSPGKLQSRWTRPYKVIFLYPNNVIKIQSLKTTQIVNVNGNQIKHLYRTIDISEIIEKTKVIIPDHNI